jgi:hypothetical protein
MSGHGCIGGYIYSKFDIRCEVNVFLQQKLVIIVLELQLGD